MSMNMSKKAVKGYKFSSDVVEKVNKDIYESNKEFSKKHIYDNLTDMQKDWISEDDVAKLYQQTSKVCYETLFTDNCLGIDSEYVNDNQLTQHVDKMIRLIKRIKRGSEITTYVTKPNFSNIGEYNTVVKAVIEYEESDKGNLIDYYSKELKSVRGNARKKVIINYVYSLLYIVDNREDFLIENRDETDARVRVAMIELSEVVNDIIKNK